MLFVGNNQLLSVWSRPHNGRNSSLRVPALHYFMVSIGSIILFIISILSVVTPEGSFKPLRGIRTLACSHLALTQNLKLSDVNVSVQYLAFTIYNLSFLLFIIANPVLSFVTWTFLTKVSLRKFLCTQSCNFILNQTKICFLWLISQNVKGQCSSG